MPFSPTDISGLKLWVKADANVYSDAGSTPAVNDDPVQQWNDQSGIGYNLSQATSGQRPLLKTNVLNSLPILRFDGSDDQIVGATGTFAAANQPLTYFIVLKKADTTNKVPMSGGTGAFLFNWSGSTGDAYAGTSLTFTCTITNWNIIGVVFNGASSIVRCNGAETTGNAGSGAFGATVTVGSYPGFPWNGDIAEVIIYDSALGSTDRASVDDYLNAKYAVFSGGDTTPPTLSSPVGTATGTTTATIGATTDEGNGTMYGVVTTNSTPPTAAQVKAGQNSSGSSAVFAGSVVVSSTGAKTISATGLSASTSYYAHLMHEDAATNQSTVVSSAQFTTNAADVTIAVNDAGLFFSPYNWVVSGSSYAQTSSTGAYLKTKFTGTKCILNCTIPSTATGAILYSIDSGVWQRASFSSSDTAFTLATGLSAGTHTLEFVVAALNHGIDRWSTPTSRFRITSLTLSGGSSVSSPTIYSGRMLVYGDSNGEGFETLGAGTSTTNTDASQAFPYLLGRALQCEVGAVSYASQGYATATGSPANVPSLANAWDLYYAATSRLSGGLFSPAPDYILCMHGQNDGSDVTSTVTSLIGSWRTAAGSSCKLVFCTPANLAHASQISAGVTAAADSKAYYVTTGENLFTGAQWSEFDGQVHLSAKGHTRYSVALSRAIQLAVGGSGSISADRSMRGGFIN